MFQFELLNIFTIHQFTRAAHALNPLSLFHIYSAFKRFGCESSFLSVSQLRICNDVPFRPTTWLSLHCLNVMSCNSHTFLLGRRCIGRATWFKVIKNRQVRGRVVGEVKGGWMPEYMRRRVLHMWPCEESELSKRAEPASQAFITSSPEDLLFIQGTKSQLIRRPAFYTRSWKGL